MNLIRTALVITSLAASALTSTAITAQPVVEQPLAAELGSSSARPALWQVSDDDTTIYLFGTIHLLPTGIDWYNGNVAQAFEGSQELVTEIPEVPEDQAMTVSMRMALLPPGETLRSQMTSAERSKFEAALAELQIPETGLDNLKPWFASVVLATAPLTRAGYGLDSGVEAQLDKRNKELGRPRSGLETLEYQLGIFNALSPQAQKSYLFETIDALPTIPQEIGKMVAAWTKGDAAALAALLNDEMDDPALYRALLTDRNRNWSAWIDDRLNRPGTVFIAVGAGHLGGKDSVQDFLGKAGIKVVRVQ